MSDKILNKVRALLTQAEDPAATAEEAEAFSRKAEELIAKYAIDLALLESQPERKGKPVTVRWEMPEGYTKAKVSLLTGIGMTHNVRVIQSNRPDGRRLILVGFESDLALVELLYTSLLVQGNHALMQASRSDRSFRTSFWYGFAYRVYERMDEMRSRAEYEATKESTSTELVLLSRKDEVDRAVEDEFPRLRKGANGRVGSPEGFGSGQAAADRADLGGARFDSGRKVLA